MTSLQRCFWVSEQPLYQRYHDNEWGHACFDEAQLFEQLCLEGQQAGLSWWTVLQKRPCYRQHFFKYSIAEIAAFSDQHIEQSILVDAGIIRHKAKLFAIRQNAQCWLNFHNITTLSTTQNTDIVTWLWSFAFYTQEELLERIPIRQHTKLSELSLDQLRSWYLSQQLKKRGFKFVGDQICHAFMQATGMFNHHEETCFCYHTVEQERQSHIQENLHK